MAVWRYGGKCGGIVSDVVERLRAALADRYEIQQEIGAGGMATVYLADDLKLRRQVAVKVLRPELAAALGLERFQREIETTANLNHPHILPLFDSGEADGFLFYVMPYVEGESLRDRLNREKRLPIGDALQIARAVADALGFAHSHDVIHRDVKPENILLHAEHPLVADFGVARAITACCDDLTGVGLTVGTPAYMSPEQAAADEDLDGRSDQYALACVVYEMLTGEPPFAGGSPRQTMARHATELAPPIRTLRADVPGPVEAVFKKALAKDPAHRHASTREFGEALAAAALQGDSGPTDVAAPSIRDHAIAVLPLVNASPDPENEYFSDGVTDELINALAQVDGLRVASRTFVFALKGEKRDVRSIGAHLGVSALLEGTVRKAGSRIRVTVQLTDVADGTHLWSEKYDRKMEDVFALQEDIAQTIVNTLRRTILSHIGNPIPKRYTENLAAYNLYLKGRYYWNLDLPQAIRYFEQAIAEDPKYALAYSGLADSYSLQLDYREIPVKESMARAKAEALRALELDESLAEAHTSLGWVTFIDEWDWDAAEARFRRAIELNPRYATAHHWNAWLLAASGRIEESLAAGRAALALDPASVSIRRSLGWLNLMARRWDLSTQHLERAVAMDPTSEENHRILGLALMHQGRGRLDDAARSLQEAVSLSDRSAYALASLGYFEAKRGQPRVAEALLAELHERSAGGRYVSSVAFVWLYLGLDDADQAFRWLETAREERRGWLAYLKVDPFLDSVRDDPRLIELIDRMRLA